MDLHPIQGGVAILSASSCYQNWVKLRPCGPPWLVYDSTLPVGSSSVLGDFVIQKQG